MQKQKINKEKDNSKQEFLHNWRPPCSCGISLDKIDLWKQPKSELLKKMAP